MPGQYPVREVKGAEMEIRQSNVKILSECGALVAVASVLSLITLFSMPLGGSVTPFATLPIIIISLRHGAKWGVASALTFSLVQLLLGLNNVAAVPVRDFISLSLCAALDYLLAYTVIGFTGTIARGFRDGRAGIVVGVLATGAGRLVCSFLSGIIVWGSYTPDGWNIAVYSLAYNASWCLPDVALTLVGCLALSRIRALNILPNKAVYH